MAKLPIDQQDLQRLDKASLRDVFDSGEFPLTEAVCRKEAIRVAFSRFVRNPGAFATSFATSAREKSREEAAAKSTMDDAVAYLADMTERAQQLSGFLKGTGSLNPDAPSLSGGGGAGGGGGGGAGRKLAALVPGDGTGKPGAMITASAAAADDAAAAPRDLQIEIPNLDGKLDALSKGLHASMGTRFGKLSVQLANDVRRVRLEPLPVTAIKLISRTPGADVAIAPSHCPSRLAAAGKRPAAPFAEKAGHGECPIAR